MVRFILFSFLIFTCQAFSQEKVNEKNFHENGKIRVSRSFDEEGRLHGPYNEYYKDGSAKVIGQYIHGKKEGEWITLNLPPWLYDDDPRFAPDPNEPQDTALISHYKNDFLEGEYMKFWSSEIEAKGSYKNGRKEGIWEYYSCGSVAKDVTCTLDEKITYSNGLKSGLAKENTAWGIAEGTYENGQRTGTWVYYYKDNDSGKIDTNKIVTYKNGELHGPFTYFEGYRNEKETHGFFKSGIIHGALKKFTEDQLELQLELNKGIPHGWLVNYNYGSTVDSIFFVNGIADGIARHYKRENDVFIKTTEAELEMGLLMRYWNLNSGEVKLKFGRDYKLKSYLLVDTLLTFDEGPLKPELSLFYYEQQQSNKTEQLSAENEMNFPISVHSLIDLGGAAIVNGAYYSGYRSRLASKSLNEFKQLESEYIASNKESENYYDYGRPATHKTILDKLNSFEWDEINEPYDNGQEFIVGNHKEGSRHGKWKVFYENGNLAIDANYKNGEQTGVWKYFDLNGTLIKAVFYDFENIDAEFRVFMLEFNQSKGEVIISVSSHTEQDDYSEPPLMYPNTGAIQKIYKSDGTVSYHVNDQSFYGQEVDLFDPSSVNYKWVPKSKDLLKWEIKTKEGKSKLKLSAQKFDLIELEKEMIQAYLTENQQRDTVMNVYAWYDEGVDSLLEPVSKSIRYKGKRKTEQYFNQDSSLLYTIEYYNGCKRSMNIEDGFFYNEGYYYYKSRDYDSVGQVQGLVKAYTNEGKLSKVYEMTHGLKNGYYIDLSGLAESDTNSFSTYVNDTLNGVSKTFYIGNKLELLSNYKMGQLHGDYRRYYKNGVIAEEGKYEEGVKVGEWIRRDIFGQLISQVNYDKDEVNSNLEVILPTKIGGEKIVSRNGRYALFARGELWDIEQGKIIKTNISNELMTGVYNYNGGYEGMFLTPSVLSNTGRYYASDDKYIDITNGEQVQLKGDVTLFTSRDNLLLTTEKKEIIENKKPDEYGLIRTDGKVIVRSYNILDTTVLDSLVFNFESFKGIALSEDEKSIYILKNTQIEVYASKGFQFMKSQQLPITISEFTEWYIAYDQLMLVDIELSNDDHLPYYINGVYQLNINSGKVREHTAFNQLTINSGTTNFSIVPGPKEEAFSSLNPDFKENKSWNSYFLPSEDRWIHLHEKSPKFRLNFGSDGMLINSDGKVISTGRWSDLVQFLPNEEKLDTIQPGFFGQSIANAYIMDDTLNLFCNSLREGTPYKLMKVDLSKGQLLDVYNYQGPHNRWGGYLESSVAKKLNKEMRAKMGELDTTLLLNYYNENKLLMQYFDVKTYNYSREGKILYDNSLFVNTNKTQPIEQLVKFYTTSSDEIIFFTPDNYYMGSSGIKKGLYFSRDFQTYPFEQFDLKYNRPDIILDRLGYADQSLIDAYHSAYQKRLKKMGFTEDMLQDDFHLPEIKIENFEEMPTLHDQGSIDIKLKLEDSKYKLDRINVWVNDVAVYGSNGISLRDKDVQDYSTTLKVDLAKGNNKVQVSVLNQAGAESYKETFEIECTAGKNDPDLYLITIGESEFQQADFNLTYAAKDAKDIAALFDKSKAYGEVKTKTLVNQEVNKENVMALKAFLAEADINDEVMIFIAGHGVLDANLDYFFATYDMDFQQPQNRGLAYEDLEGLLDGIKPLKKTLMIDACHSGEIDKDEVELAQADINEGDDIQFRAVGNTASPKLGMQNTSELTKSLFTDLRKGTGATVISSAGGMEFAMEGDDWSNGLFTYCFIKGIQSKEADYDKNGEIWLSEIKRYVSEQVTELSNGKQQPTSRIENQTVDFRVW